MTTAVNQSINQREICRAPLYETSRSANSSQWYARSKSTLLIESFSECTGVGNVVEVGRKSVPGGWATVGETSFPKSSSVYTVYCTHSAYSESVSRDRARMGVAFLFEAPAD